MQIKDRQLFLKYALPCSSTLVRRGRISESDVKKMENILDSGKGVNVDLENIFLIAFSMCKLSAKIMGKEAIDKEVIRDYFWYKHDEVVDRRFEEMGDFDPVMCKTRPGKVIELHPEIKVRTPSGKFICKKSFCPVKRGDFVILHYDYIIEKIDEKIAKNLWERKKKFNR